MAISEQPALDAAAIAELEGAFHGRLVRPSDADYDERRAVWNGSIDRRPALIARCATVDDVAAAVRFARAQDLRIAVRGGGHSFPGLSTCDGGLVIDLGAMDEVRVEPDTRAVSVQGGTLLGGMDAATQPYGLAVPAGIVTHTGVAGLTLGGGIGWLHRKHGLTIDSLRAVEVVTATGEVVRASANENADLFWGVRGGGGNFGVVTTFEFDAVPLGPEVMGGPVFWLIEDAPKVLRFYRDWIAHAPDELMTIVATRRAADLPIVPRDLVGRHVIAITACYAGPVADGERVVAPLKSFGSPVLDGCMPRPFVDHQKLFDPGFEPGWWYYFRACDVAELTDDVIDVVVEYGSKIVSPITSIALWQMGGAVARVGEDETAFNGRRVGFTFNINGNTVGPDGFDAEREWARAYWSALEPWHTSVYVNFLMEEGEERVRQAYGDAKYERLKAVKRAWDPDNVFRLNQNIRPD